MVTRFGSREICDVTFKALSNNQRVGNREFKAGQPVFVIDTATTSNMEQASTTVYAQGGRGYNRLIAWEGEKTMTFTVTDALMSPLGLAVLTGAGFKAEGEVKHVHVTYDVALDSTGAGSITAAQLAAELGLPMGSTVQVCDDAQLVPYATVLDNNGAIVDWVDSVTLSGETGAIADVIFVDNSHPLAISAASAASKTIKLDFYVRMTTGATEITIAPDDFGGFFYVEADTLYRNQDGKDMAATITFPKVKIQSGFTLPMAASGDPSTFDFVMDAFPAYTYFDQVHKVVCDITIVSGADAATSGVQHETPVEHEVGDASGTNVAAVSAAGVAHMNIPEATNNQNAVSVAFVPEGNRYEVSVNGTLQAYASTEAGQGTAKWIALDIDTGAASILDVQYNGHAFTQQDVDDATSLGLGAGHFVYWAKDTALNKAQTVKITGTDYEKVITIVRV